MKLLFNHSQCARSSRPGRDVGIALAIKMVLLTALYGLFFSPSHKPPANASVTGAALLGIPESEQAK